MAQALGVSLRTPSPAGQAGRGRGEVGGGDRALALASELLHRPDKPAGVAEKSEEEARAPALASELLHRPDKPAGVHSPVKFAILVKDRDALSQIARRRGTDLR